MASLLVESAVEQAWAALAAVGRGIADTTALPVVMETPVAAAAVDTVVVDIVVVDIVVVVVD